MLWAEDAFKKLSDKEIDQEEKLELVDRLRMMFNFYFFDHQRQKVNIEEFKGMFSMYWSDTGALGEDSIHVTDNAKLLQNLVKYLELTGDTDSADARRYEELAESITDYLISLEDPEGGIFRFSTLKDKNDLDDTFHGGKDTLDNIYAWVALERYISFLENKNDEANNKRIEALKQMSKGIRTFIDSQFDSEKGYFRAGRDLDDEQDWDLNVDLQLTAYFALTQPNNGDAVNKDIANKYFRAVEFVFENTKVEDNVRRFRRVIPTDWLQDDFTRKFWYARQMSGLGFGKKGEVSKPDPMEKQLTLEEQAKTLAFVDNQEEDQISYTLTTKAIIAYELQKQRTGQAKYEASVNDYKEMLDYSLVPDTGASSAGLPAASDYGENYKEVVNSNHDDLNNLEPTTWYEWAQAGKVPDFGKTKNDQVLILDKNSRQGLEADTIQDQRTPEDIEKSHEVAKQEGKWPWLNSVIKGFPTIPKFTQWAAEKEFVALEKINNAVSSLALPAFIAGILGTIIWLLVKRRKEGKKDPDLMKISVIDPIIRARDVKDHSPMNEADAELFVIETINARIALLPNPDVGDMLAELITDSPALRMWVQGLSTGIIFNDGDRAVVSQDEIVQSIDEIISNFSGNGIHANLLEEENILDVLSLRLGDIQQEVIKEYKIRALAGSYKKGDLNRELKGRITDFNKKFPADAKDTHDAEKMQDMFEIIKIAELSLADSADEGIIKDDNGVFGLSLQLEALLRRNGLIINKSVLMQLFLSILNKIAILTE